jgi:hypothetical protein
MAILLSGAKKIDEVLDLGDLLLRESTDFLEEILFAERISHGGVVPDSCRMRKPGPPERIRRTGRSLPEAPPQGQGSAEVSPTGVLR